MKTVFVVGAGPAGMFAAQKIALAGHQVVIFNRDIKHGGLAEYGIYLVKDKMKSGLRKQFAKVLVPAQRPLLRPRAGRNQASQSPWTTCAPSILTPSFSPSAPRAPRSSVCLAKTPRASIRAKDFVYFYNSLPPFASQDFSTGKKIAIVGMGNVMVDIARWVLLDNPNRETEELTIVARRGPFEAKFDEKEIKYVES